MRGFVKRGVAKSGGTFWNVKQNTGNTDQLPKIRFQVAYFLLYRLYLKKIILS